MTRTAAFISPGRIIKAHLQVAIIGLQSPIIERAPVGSDFQAIGVATQSVAYVKRQYQMWNGLRLGEWRRQHDGEQLVIIVPEQSQIGA